MVQMPAANRHFAVKVGNPSSIDGPSFGLTVDEPFEDVVATVRDALEAEGFSIVSTIDVSALLCEQLDEFTAPYLILGACNLSLASWAIRTDPAIGVLLSCNVVVREIREGVRVELADPEFSLGPLESTDLADVAHEVKRRLKRVAEAVRMKSAREDATSSPAIPLT